MDVGHLAQDADLVGVEIGEVLPFVLVVAEDLGQGFIAVLVGVDIGISCLCRCTPAIGGCRRTCCEAVRWRRSRGGYGGRCGRVGRPVGKCRSRNRLRQTAAVHRRRGRRFGRGRLKNRNRVRAFRAHITSELKVLCGATACFECAGCF